MIEKLLPKSNIVRGIVESIRELPDEWNDYSSTLKHKHLGIELHFYEDLIRIKVAGTVGEIEIHNLTFSGNLLVRARKWKTKHLRKKWDIEKKQKRIDEEKKVREEIKHKLTRIDML